jgi:hypothetical protein
MTKKYKITGMDCPSCASMLECDLEDAGIKCKCSYFDNSLAIEGKHDFDKLVKIVGKMGCSVSPIVN